jgi:hypothetical protein
VRLGDTTPWAMSEMIRGETNASGARNLTCRSTLPSCLAISAKEATRPSTRSSIQTRALAIAVSNASRLSGFTAGVGEGEWRIPLTSAWPARTGDGGLSRDCRAGFPGLILAAGALFWLVVAKSSEGLCCFRSLNARHMARRSTGRPQGRLDQISGQEWSVVEATPGVAATMSSSEEQRKTFASFEAFGF